MGRRRPSKAAKTVRVATVSAHGGARSKPKKMLGDITGVILNNLKQLDAGSYHSNPVPTDVTSKESVSHKPANIGLKVVMSQL